MFENCFFLNTKPVSKVDDSFVQEYLYLDGIEYIPPQSLPEKLEEDDRGYVVIELF